MKSTYRNITILEYNGKRQPILDLNNIFFMTVEQLIKHFDRIDKIK